MPFRGSGLQERQLRSRYGVKLPYQKHPCIPFDFRNLPNFKFEKMLEIMKTDKKSDGKKITFVLPVDYSSVECFEYEDEDLKI